MTAVKTAAEGAALRERESAEERREQVLEAALREFAEHGYQGCSTADIARRAGISQPYIYALFPSKKELFLSVHERVTERLRSRFQEAVRGARGHEVLHRIGAVYPELISDRYVLLCQLQCYAACGDPEIRPRVAQAYRRLFDDIAAWSGAGPEEMARFFAVGMLANITTALGLPEICEPLWHEPDR